MSSVGWESEERTDRLDLPLSIETSGLLSASREPSVQGYFQGTTIALSLSPSPD